MEETIIMFTIIIPLMLLFVLFTMSAVLYEIRSLIRLIKDIREEYKEETIVYRPWEDPCAEGRKIWVKSMNTPPDYRDPYDK